MNLSELIKDLEDIKTKHGDIPVVFCGRYHDAWIPYNGTPLVENAIENHDTGLYCVDSKSTQMDAAVNSLGARTKVVVLL